jgi:hypothetical protein
VVRLLEHLAGLPHHGLPLLFPMCPSSYALPKSVDSDVGANIPRSRGEARWQPMKKERG